jgi:hypothetical protein
MMKIVTLLQRNSGVIIGAEYQEIINLLFLKPIFTKECTHELSKREIRGAEIEFNKWYLYAVPSIPWSSYI